MVVQKLASVFIHPDLKDFLSRYDAPKSGYLFPTDSVHGHISRRGVDKYSNTELG